MLKITEYVPASKIWETAQDNVDLGEVEGVMRGYNIEVTRDGNSVWMSAEWIYGDPEVVFNDEYHRWSRNEYGFTPTGRICFRGYGIEEYSHEERDTFVKHCNVEMVNGVCQVVDV